MIKRKIKIDAKWIVGALALFLVLTTFGFRHHLFKFSVRTYFNVAFPCESGWDFSYKKAEWKNKKFVLSDIVLTTKTETCEMHIEEARIGIKKSSPKMFLSKFAIILDERKGKERFSLFSIIHGLLAKWIVDIEDGKGLLIEDKEEIKPIPLFFSFSSGEKKRSLGRLILSQGEGFIDGYDVAIQFYAWPRETIMEVEWQEGHLPWLSSLAGFFSGPSYFLSDVTEGTMNGRLWIGFYPEGVISQMNATLGIRDFHAINAGKDIETSFYDMQLDFTYPSGKRVSNLEERFSWQNCVFKSNVKGGIIHYKDPGKSNEYALCDLSGPINFNSFKDSEIQMQGYLDQRGHLSPIILRGNPSLLDPNTLDLDLRLFLDPEEENITKLGISITAMDDHCYAVKGRVEDLSKQQIGIIQHVVGLGFEPINDFHIAEGSLTIEVGAMMEKGMIRELFVEQLMADHLQIYWKSADVLAFCSKCLLKADFDMNHENPLAFPDVTLQVVHGDVIIGREASESWSISDLDLDMTIQKGHFLPSRLTGNVFGAWTELMMSGPYNDADLVLKCSMDRDWIVSHLAPLPKEFNSLSPLKEVVTKLQFHRQKGYWNVLGRSIFHHDNEIDEELEFGYFISDDIFGFQGKNCFSLYQTALSKGWFQTKSVSGKSINFFTDCFGKPFKITGALAVEGTFDKYGLYFKVGSKSCKFTTEDSELSLGNEGQFYYDFLLKEWKGNVPIEGAMFEDKMYGLKLHDIHAHLNFEHDIFDLDHLSVESEGMQLQGRARVTVDSKGLESFLVQADHIEGSSLQLEQLLHHFQEFHDWKLPFNGKIETLPRGAQFSGRRGKEGIEVDWDIACRLIHGSFDIGDHYRIEDFRFDLLSNSQDKEIQLLDIRGRLPSKEGKFYRLYGKEANLFFGDDKSLSCDLRFQSSTIDLFRLVIDGKYDKTKECWKITFDEEKSHLLNEHFQSKRCWLSESKGLQLLEGTIDFSLSNLHYMATLAHDLQIGVSEEALDFCEKIPLNGRLQAVVYKGNKGIKISLVGHEIKFGQWLFNDLNVGIEKRGNIWKVHRFSLDDMFVQAKLTEEEECLDISDFALLCKDTRLFVERGKFSFATKHLEIPIESMMIDLEQMSKFFPTQRFVNGLCSLSGKLGVSFKNEGEPFSIAGDIGISSDGFLQDQFELKTNQSLVFTYGIDQGLKIQGGAFSITGKNDPDIHFSLICDNGDLKSASYIKAEGITAIASNSAIQYLLTKLPITKGQESLVAKFPYSWKGYTECIFSVFLEDKEYKIVGFCPEDYYHIADHYHHVNEVSFQIDPDVIDLSAKIPFFDETVLIQSHTIAKEPYLTEIKGYKAKDEMASSLISLSTPQGVMLHNLQGNLCGLDFSFLPKPKMTDAHAMTFLGSVKVDGALLAPYVKGAPGEFLKEIQLKKGYELTGEFTYFKDKPENSYFDGFIKGKNFQLLGFEFTTMLGNVQMKKGEVLIENLTVSDDSVGINIPKISIDQESHLQMAEMVIRDLRPSLMRKSRRSHLRLKPFCIHQMVFQDVSGSLKDLRTLTGKGSLIFENTFKRDHHILDIPIELISRLGLDMVLLVPIHGEMDYVINNGKVMLTKLRNSYSEGKRSHFYLSSSKDSFIDFHGNIQMQIKMKQYVLFKITELFVLTVSGTLEDPQFGLK